MRLYNGVRLLDGPSLVNVRRLDLGALPMIVEFHKNGMAVDPGHLARVSRKLGVAMEEKQAEILRVLGPVVDDDFNVGSPDDVADVLFGRLKIQGKQTLKMTRGGPNARPRPSTVDDVLTLFKKEHPAVGLILDWRELAKLKGTYADALPKLAVTVDGVPRVFSTFTHTRARTGRLASKTPNIQNIPTRGAWGSEIRNGFVASPGCLLVSNDLSQIEIVWTAHLSQAKVMMQAVTQDDDIHTLTASQLFADRLLPLLTPYGYNFPGAGDLTAFMLDLARRIDAWEKGDGEPPEEPLPSIWKKFKKEMRLPSKTINFAIVYGTTDKGLQAQIYVQGELWVAVEVCSDYIARWFDLYWEVKQWMQLQAERVLHYGYNWDAFGRIRPCPGIKSVHEYVRSKALREAGNHPVQGSAQGTIKLVMAEVQQEIVPKYRLKKYGPGPLCTCNPAAQIHDELLTDVSKEAAADYAHEVREVMGRAVRLSVPVRGSSDVGERWGDLK